MAISLSSNSVLLLSFAAFFWPRGHVDWIKLQAIYTKLTMSPVSASLVFSSAARRDAESRDWL